MKSIIIADSSALFSLLIETDSNYKKAIAISKRFINLKAVIIIPTEVFTELINVLGKKFNHDAAIEATTLILDSKIFNIENSEEEMRNKALEKFKKVPKSVSYTDCLVMAFADHFETKEIFGFDQVFNKNGYLRLGVDTAG